MEPLYPKKERKSPSRAQLPITTISDRPRQRLSQRSLLLGLGCFASLALLSKGTVWAQTETPPTDAAAPAQSEPPPAPEPAFIAPEPAPAAPEPEAAAEQPAPAATAPAPVLDEPYITEPPPAPALPPEAPAAVAPAPEPPPPETPTAAEPPPPSQPNNAYIDSTDYSIGATDTYEAPNAVHFSERSSGCDAVLGSGQAISGALCAPPPSGSVAEGSPWNSNAETAAGTTDGTYSQGKPWQAGLQPPEAGYGQSASTPTTGDGYYAATAYAGSSGGGGSLPGIGSIQVGPITVTSMSNSGFAYYNRTARPPAMPGNGNLNLLFPLSIAAPITSVFGWRTHPVLGYSRFHTGTDLGAPLGTPVLAAFAGQVAIADWLGGYGLAVVLDHNKQSQETLYGHLSELFVKPGEWVQQGEVIGRVGSTGMSTGPHLHFELRQMTKEGWVAVDPGTQLEFALAQMLNPLRAAKVPQLPSMLVAQAAGAKDFEGMPQLPPLPYGLDIDIPNLQPTLPAALMEPDTSKKDIASKPNN